MPHKLVIKINGVGAWRARRQCSVQRKRWLFLSRPAARIGLPLPPPTAQVTAGGTHGGPGWLLLACGDAPAEWATLLISPLSCKWGIAVCLLGNYVLVPWAGIPLQLGKRMKEGESKPVSRICHIY